MAGVRQYIRQQARTNWQTWSVQHAVKAPCTYASQVKSRQLFHSCCATIQFGHPFTSPTAQHHSPLHGGRRRAWRACWRVWCSRAHRACHCGRSPPGLVGVLGSTQGQEGTSSNSTQRKPNQDHQLQLAANAGSHAFYTSFQASSSPERIRRRTDRQGQQNNRGRRPARPPSSCGALERDVGVRELFESDV